MTALEFLLIAWGSAFLIPLIVYLTVKAGRYGWLRANDTHRESQEFRVREEILRISREAVDISGDGESRRNNPLP